MHAAAGALAEGRRGNSLAIYEQTADVPLRLPTAVAIGPQDQVYVLDGVHERIVEFHPDGRLARIITAFGDETFHQPVGLYCSPAGELWVADSGAGRVVVGSAAGALQRTISLPAGAEARRHDPTAVALTADGKSAWIVDNDLHRVLRFELESGAFQVFGRLGSGLGQFEYPFQIAVAPGGDLLVSDVINARVQLLSPDGNALRSIGTYGVELGQFHRPGGLAVDTEGNAWVADSITGVIQIFRPDNSLLDVLRGPDDQPLRFDAPLDLAFDRQGRLYVVESRANRVRQVGIERTDRRPSPPPPRGGLAAAGQQSKSCTLCHIEWLPPFSDGRNAGLMDRPVTSKADPAVARAEMCLSCHDGSVADSRRRVWEDHGHATGVAPPESMSVPAHLPLIEGKLACRTCHSAHGSDVPQGDFRRAVLLRVPNPASELCVTCHVDKTRGPRFGTHPTGGMPWAIPEKLVEAGAKVGPNPRELTCQVCHTPHGAKNDHLLVLGTSSNQLCTTCHDQMRPGMFRDGSHAEHPLTAKLNDEQLAAVRDLGTKTGPEGQLVCLTCHKLHHGFGQRFMLADELAEGQMCLRCHSERRQMVGSAHDLRTNFPQERNRLGLTAAEGGPCSSCHLFHRFARTQTPGPGDRDGQCLTCHQPGHCASDQSLPAVNHPSLRCTECHNPHETRFGDFLKVSPAQLCSSCHADKAGLLGGPHDAGLLRAEWCRSGEHAADPCLSCHRPHGDEAHALFRVAPVAGVSPGSAACMACHADAGPDAAGSRALRHPVDRPGAEVPGVMDAPGRAELVNCASCHDPHAPAPQTNFLRDGGASGAELCLNCHADMRHIAITAHSPASLAQHDLNSTACLPCHQVHGHPADVASRRLWPAHLLGAADGAEGVADVLCLGCHRDGGPARQPVTASHPALPMFNMVTAAGDAVLPLFGSDGEVDPHGRITCRTCHLPHGRELGTVAPVTLERTPATAALQPGLRRFAAPNLCTNCHGADALRRFLYFHDPQRRAGGLTEP